MAIAVVLFLLLLVITFSVVLYMTRPTKEETDLGNRLAGFSRGSRAEAVVDPDIILKREVYSDLPIINAILRRVKLAADLDTLIKQANSSLTVGRVLFGALVIAVRGRSTEPGPICTAHPSDLFSVLRPEPLRTSTCA